MTYIPGGGSGGHSIATSSDVALNNPATNEVLTYDASVGKWKNTAISASSEIVDGLITGDAGNTAANAESNRVAIQTALDSATKTNGTLNLVRLPAGKLIYLELAVNPTDAARCATLFIPSGIILDLNGSILKLRDGSVRPGTSSYAHMIENPNPSGSPRNQRSYLINGTVDGNAVNNRSFVCQGVGWLKADNYHCQDVIVKDCKAISGLIAGGESFHFDAWRSTNCTYTRCEAIGTDTRWFSASTTSGSTTLTADAAQFNTSDTGMMVAGKGIPDGTSITYVNSTSVTLSNAATSTNTSIVYTIGDVSTGFSANFATNIRWINCSVDKMAIASGFTAYKSANIQIVSCRSTRNTGRGFNFEYCEEALLSSSIAGGVASSAQVTGDPLAAGESLGNRGGGFTSLGGKNIRVIGNILASNGVVGWGGHEHGAYVQGDSTSYPSNVRFSANTIVNNGAGVTVSASGGTDQQKLDVLREVRVDADNEISGNTTTAFNLPTWSAPAAGFNGGMGAVTSGYCAWNGGISTGRTPAVPASGQALQTIVPFGVEVYINGGTVTDIAVGTPESASKSTGATGGRIHIPAGGSITLTYSSPPTWTWWTA